MKYRTTVLSISIHSESENPIFGECATHVCLEDEAAGPFIVLKQCNDDAQPGQVRLTFEELAMIAEAAEQLKQGVEKWN